MKTNFKLLTFILLALLESVCSSSNGNSNNCDDKWCVGKWKGKLNTQMHEEFTIRIHEDHTCSVKSNWFWGSTRSADFEAEWEPVSEDIIKIFDYDGHNENLNGFNGINQRRIDKWSMYLNRDGAFCSEPSRLNNPDGYLIKQ